MNNMHEQLVLAQQKHRNGEIAEASDLYQKIATENPKATDAWYGLGHISLQMQRFDLARKFLLEAVKWNKRNIDYYICLARAHAGLGDFEDAVVVLKKAMKLKPGQPGVLNELAVVHTKKGEYKESIKLLQRVLKIDPKYNSAYINLANAYIQDGDASAAVDVCRKGLSRDSANPVLRYNLGRALIRAGDYTAAIEELKQALEVSQEQAVNVLLLVNLGAAHLHRGDFPASEEYLARAIELSPDYAEAHYLMAKAFLHQGELEKGWKEYAWSILIGSEREKLEAATQARWSGESLDGKTLGVLAEQGLGDELRFANMYNDAIDKAEKCIIECDQRLIPLFARSFPTAKFVERTHLLPPEFSSSNVDYIATAADMALHLRSDIADFPQQPGYLIVDETRKQSLHNELSELGDFPKIGICWRSMLVNYERSEAYSALEEWAPLLRRDDIVLVNLQYDDCTEELARIKKQLGVSIHNTDIDLKNDIDGTAALIASLDIVISAPTAIAALAGAVGTPTVSLVASRAWTQLGTEFNPWYSNTTMVEKQADESWEDVLGSVSNKLFELVSVE